MNKKGNALLKDIVIYFFGYVAPKVISFILVPIYTAYLSTEEYGANDYIHTVIQALTPIISLQIPGTIMRFVIKDENYTKKEIVSNGFCLFSIMGLITIGITMAVYYIFDFSVSYFWLIIAMGFSGVVYTMVAETARGLGYTKTYAAIGVLNTLLNTSLSILFIVKIRMSYNGLLLAASIASLICIIILFIVTGLIKYLSVRALGKKCSAYILKYALPLIPNAVSWWALSMSDKLVIEPFLGFGANGIYGIAGKLASVISIFYHAFDKAWMVNAIKEFDSKDKENFYTDVFDKLFRVMILVCGVLLLINRVFMRFWVDESYYSAWEFSIPLILSTVFYCYSQFFGVAYNCSKKTNEALYTTLLAAAVNLGISLLLVKIIGLYAMAYATLIAYIILFIVRKKNTSKYFPVKVKYSELIIQVIILGGISALNYVNNFYISIPIQAALLGLLLFLNRKVIMSIPKEIIKKRRRT